VVAPILGTRRINWVFWSLVLLFGASKVQSYAGEERARCLFAQRDVSPHEERFFEEDLPPEELPADTSPAVREPAPAGTEPVFQSGEALSSGVTAPLSVHVPLSPQDIVALRFVEEGKGLLEKENFDLARERFERAVSIAPQQPYSYYFLGRVLFAQGDYKQSLAFLQKAELLFRANDQAWRGEAACLKGAIYEDQGDSTQARTAYRQCLEFTPQNLSALSALARLPAEEPVPRDYFTPEPSFYPRD